MVGGGHGGRDIDPRDGTLPAAEADFCKSLCSIRLFVYRFLLGEDCNYITEIDKEHLQKSVIKAVKSRRSQDNLVQRR